MTHSHRVLVDPLGDLHAIAETQRSDPGVDDHPRPHAATTIVLEADAGGVGHPRARGPPPARRSPRRHPGARRSRRRRRCSSKSDVAVRPPQFLGGELRRRDVDEHAGAALEAGDGHELRPQVRRASGTSRRGGAARCGTRGCRRCHRRRSRSAARLSRIARPTAARSLGSEPWRWASCWRGMMSISNGVPLQNGQITSTCSSSNTTRTESASSASTVAHRMQPPSKRAKARSSSRISPGHERHAEQLSVRVRQRRARLATLVDDGLRVADLPATRRALPAGRAVRPSPGRRRGRRGRPSCRGARATVPRPRGYRSPPPARAPARACAPSSDPRRRRRGRGWARRAPTTCRRARRSRAPAGWPPRCRGRTGTRRSGSASTCERRGAKSDGRSERSATTVTHRPFSGFNRSWLIVAKDYGAQLAYLHHVIAAPLGADSLRSDCDDAGALLQVGLTLALTDRGVFR